ncbi:hypothetical protein ACZ90_66615 [Streptomyces albus subsp. albus]|nr:hypothetical protein ACZ90_66615 [Streptomyces albus subsp. albus]
MIYEERKLPKKWITLWCSLYLVGIGYLAMDTIPDDVGLWLGMSAFLVMVLLVFLVAPVTNVIYYRIQIDGHTLRVGRERITLADIDPVSVQVAAQQPLPGFVERYVTSLSTIDAPLPGLRAEDLGTPRLLGGGWAVPAGRDSVVIATRRGECLCIVTRDRTAFLSALGAALGSVPQS